MRQAGRSLPEYRQIRAEHDLFSICRQPELCAEVTLQPVERHRVDAAVIYSDIMVPVLGMGADVELVEGVGPVVGTPIRTGRDVEALLVADPEDTVPYALEAIRLVRRDLAPERALVGFAGGPFTVAGYLVEGRPSRTFTLVKRLMYGSPAVWHALMDRLAAALSRYVEGQVRAGADAIQLFDSWVGVLSVTDYEEFVAPYSQRILAAVDAPTIHFATGCTHLLPSLARAGGDVIGIDWRLPLDDAWKVVGHDRAVQGNLDPAVLLSAWERVESDARRILALVDGRPGHIFNLGHGVLPETDPAVLTQLVELVGEASGDGSASPRAASSCAYT